MRIKASMLVVAGGLLAVFFGTSLTLHAQEAVHPSVVRSIFQQRCFECHGADRQKGDLRLDSPEDIQKGGDDGAVIVAGDAAASKLHQLITLPAGDPDIMPPKGDPLTPDQIAAVTQWINEGASFDGWDDAPPAPPVKANAVRAILEARCVECHGPEKQKENLRLDTPELIMQGGEHGVVVVAENPDESKLYKLVALPAGDPDIMPPKGDPLTLEEQETIRRWIAEGANFEAWDEPLPVVDSAPVSEVDVYNPVQVSALYADDILKKLAEGVAQPPADAVKALEAMGVQVLPIHQGSPLLRVNFQFAGEAYCGDLLDLLQPIAPNVTWLNLSGMPVTDDHLAKIAGLGNLTALHLDNTTVTDAGLAHLKGLPHLEYLNLYNTQVGDASADALKSLSKLKRLYLWQTQITSDTAKALNEALPDAVINMGIQ